MKKEPCSEAFIRDAIERYGDAVYRLARCRLNNRTDAEDVYQEVFLQLLCESEDFHDGEHLKAWLLRVTFCRCTDMRRTAWFRRTVPLESVAETGAEEISRENEVWQVVDGLPEELRTVVYLYYVEGYQTDEIAEMTGCRPATVRTRLHRARKKLKLDLEGNQNEIAQSH